MDNQNTGSFGAAIGGADPLQEAIARRQTGQAGATAQVSPTAPTSVNQVPPSSPSPTPTAIGGTPQPSMGGSPGLVGGKSEAQLIISALDSRLKSLSKVQEMGGSV